MNAAIQSTIFFNPIFHSSFWNVESRLAHKKMNFLFLSSPKLRYWYLINNITPEDTVPSQYNPFPKSLTRLSNIPLYVINEPKLKFPHISAPFGTPTQNFIRNCNLLRPGFSPFLVILDFIFL